MDVLPEAMDAVRGRARVVVDGSISRGTDVVKAIALGADAFVHAPSSTGVVRVERLGSSYWSQRFVAARRVVVEATPR